MQKMSPRRSHHYQRNKGFKVKHALQMCVLLGVCLWLLYQVQHSRNKEVSYEESTNHSNRAETTTGKNHNGFIKLGRKDLDPRIDEMTTKDLKNGGQDAEEGKSFDDENKPAEPKQDQEKEKVDESGESSSMDRHKETQESKENVAAPAENGNAAIMNAKEQDEPENSQNSVMNQNKSSESGIGSNSKELKISQENNSTNAANLGNTGETSLDDNSNPSEGTTMEAKDQQQVHDKSATDSTKTENGDKSNAADHGTNLVNNSNPTVGSHEGKQEHYRSTTNSTDSKNKPVQNDVSSGDLKETVIKEQTETSDANSTPSSVTGESTLNSGKTEMTEDLTEQISDDDSGSGIKINPSNDNEETTNPGENNSTDSSTSQNEESSSGSTGNPNDVQHNQLESSSSVLKEETDARTDMETMPQSESAGNNHEAAE